MNINDTPSTPSNLFISIDSRVAIILSKDN